MNEKRFFVGQTMKGKTFEMKAVILAAGYATRLYPLTKDKPKALLPIGKQTMLDTLVEKICAQPEITEIHVVSNHPFYSQLCGWAEGAKERYAPVLIQIWDDGTSSNETRRGAIGDIQFTIESAKLDDDLLVAASDNLLDKPLDGFFEDFRKNGKDVLLANLMDDAEELKRYAVLSLDENGVITDLVEKPETPKSNVVANAVYLYRKDTLPEIIRYLEEGNNPDSPGHFPEWLYRRKTVRAHLYEGNCWDIGTVKSYYEIQESWKD